MISGFRRLFAGLLFVALFTVVPAGSQTLGELDFSDARLSIAGPDRFYVRNVVLDDTAMSGLLQLGEDGRWYVQDFFPSSRDRFDLDLVLDFVEVTTDGVDEIRIDGIILDNAVYSGSLHVGEDAAVDFDATLEPGLPGRRAVDAATALESLLAEGERRAYQRRIEELETDLEHAQRDRDILLSMLEDDPDEETLAREARRLDSRIQQLQSDLDQVTSSRVELAERLAVTEQERDDLIIVNAELRDEIAVLERTVTRLDEEIVALQSEIDTLSLAGDTSDLLTAEAFGREADELRAFLAEADLRLRELEEQAAETETRAQADSRTRALEARVRSELSLLRAELSATRSDRDVLEQRTLLSLLEDGIVASAADRPGRTLQRGFSGGVPQLGAWTVTDSVLEQTSTREFFAKYVIPVQQGSETTLYRFTVDTTARGWAGAGLHFSASSSSLRGYGFGESLLVWFTRDPAHYQNDRTYLQLYRSDDDVRMERVLDAQIEPHIADGLEVEILYEPTSGYVTVAVNGDDTVRYRTWFDVEAGFEVALRSLGDGARFADLEIIAISDDRR